MSLAARIHRWRGDLHARGRSGSAAIEFAFVAPVFFVLLGGIIESGMIALSQSVLIKATQDAARQVRTGEAQGKNAQAFRNMICDGLGGLMSCDQLQVDVQPYTGGFGTPANPIKNGQLDASLNKYDTGKACDVVVVRAFYPWKINTPGMTLFLSNAKSGTGATSNDIRVLSAASAFRNEPFTSGVAGC